MLHCLYGTCDDCTWGDDMKEKHDMVDYIYCGNYGLEYVKDFFNRTGRYPKMFPVDFDGIRRTWAHTFLEGKQKKVSDARLESQYWG